MSNLIRYRVLNKSHNLSYGDYFTIQACKAKITRLTTNVPWRPSKYKKEEFEIVEYQMVELRRANFTNKFAFNKEDAPQVKKLRISGIEN